MNGKARQVLDRLGASITPSHWREAALCVPAIPVLILGGYALEAVSGGVIAAGAAFAVGFGAARELRGRRWAAMLGAWVGMSLAAFFGTLLGPHTPAFVFCAAAAAAGCAALALYDEDMWWVILQIVIIFFVAGFYGGPWESAVDRTGMVAIGGAVQLAAVWCLARLYPRAAQAILQSAIEQVTDRSLLIAHMVRAALCVGGGILLVKHFGLDHGYWAPMTALIVLKPRLHETRARGLARLGGTIGGGLVATLFATLASDWPLLLVVGISVAAGAAYALQKAHYAVLTASITATVVLMVTLAQPTPLLNAEHRFVATLLGGVLALVVAWLVPHSIARIYAKADRVGAETGGS